MMVCEKMFIYLFGWRKFILKGELKSNKIILFFIFFGLNECEIVNSLERGCDGFEVSDNIVIYSVIYLLCMIWM